MREYNFDGLVGPTHHYGGLSYGNLASEQHRGEVGDPRGAALQGLKKMRTLCELGVGQAVLPPQLRPSLRALRRLGFAGAPSRVLERAQREAPELLSLCGSSSAMWTANAATVAPSCDTTDARVHFTPANLTSLFHRSLEARATTATLRAIFAKPAHFVVHDPLPAGSLFSDEGAANHLRLATARSAVHVYAWGRAAQCPASPHVFPARQSLEASRAVARLHGARSVFAKQSAAGIDLGAFHSDVLAVANENVLLLHELAFEDTGALLGGLQTELGAEFRSIVASSAELPVAEAIAAYPFNSQLVTLPSGKMAIVAPVESERHPAASGFLERVVNTDNPVERVLYVDVNGSMKNGGGPACLRLRVPLSDVERGAIDANVFFDSALEQALEDWTTRHYRDRVAPSDLADPVFYDENRRALSELSRILRVPIDVDE
ncbi:MAG TPA: N-succinylarginine dihydrolase [Polyangiaceae bacterium]|jgi:succinylarginine dihydrolase